MINNNLINDGWWWFVVRDPLLKTLAFAGETPAVELDLQSAGSQLARCILECWVFKCFQPVSLMNFVYLQWLWDLACFIHLRCFNRFPAHGILMNFVYLQWHHGPVVTLLTLSQHQRGWALLQLTEGNSNTVRYVKLSSPSYIAHVDPCCIIDVWMYHSCWLVFHIVAWFLLISGLLLHFQMNKYRGLFCISMNRRVRNWAALGERNQVWRLQTWDLQHDDDGDGQVDHNDDDKMEPASLGQRTAERCKHVLWTTFMCKTIAPFAHKTMCSLSWRNTVSG